MIIVSQDKMEIVNLNNIENIWICPDEEGRFSIEATAKTNSTLGYYKMQERAKEVLQEIGERYEGWQNLVYGQPSGICNPRYEMPEE